jgi:hypothetical protein
MIAMDAKDDPVNGEDADPDEMEPDDIGRDRGRVDKGEVGQDKEGLREITEMMVKASGHKVTGSWGSPIGLRDPENMRIDRGNERPNNGAVVVLQNKGLKARTRPQGCRRQAGDMHVVEAELISG